MGWSFELRVGLGELIDTPNQIHSVKLPIRIDNPILQDHHSKNQFITHHLSFQKDHFLYNTHGWRRQTIDIHTGSDNLPPG